MNCEMQSQLYGGRLMDGSIEEEKKEQQFLKSSFGVLELCIATSESSVELK